MQIKSVLTYPDTRKNFSILDIQYSTAVRTRKIRFPEKLLNLKGFLQATTACLPLKFSLYYLIISPIQVWIIYRRVKTITTKKLSVHKKGTLIFLSIDSYRGLK